MNTQPHACWSLFGVSGDCVYIMDEDIGRSVTNDAERVVREVVARHGNRRIIYRDTMGRWDVLVHVNGTFVGFAPCAEKEIPQ